MERGPADMRAVPDSRRVAVAPGLPTWAWSGAVACAAFALLATGALVWAHFTKAALPGCGPSSACAGIENHAFGRVLLPGPVAGALGFAKWPVSFLGFAYYAGLLTALLASGARAGPGLRWLVRGGVVVSLVYLAVIVAESKYCKYCLASHAANFGVLIFLEVGMLQARLGGRAGAGRRGVGAIGAAAAVFALATGALGMKEREKAGAEAAAAERQLEEDTAALRAKAEQDRAAAEAGEKAGSTGQDAALSFGPNGFTGRWRLGPEQAVARIVVYSDYQCEYCKRIEAEAMRLREQYPDKVSLSAKQFPLNTACNPAAGVDMHANACFAAKAAETIGLLKGNEAFWQMHRWLFDRGGLYNDEQLIAKLKEMGVSVEAFGALYDSDAVKKAIEADSKEATALGVVQTPMVFVNGVEFRAWWQAGGLERTVKAVIDAGAPAVAATSDRPMTAKEKYVEDWRQEMLRQIPAPSDGAARALGETGAPVDIVVFGDYLEPNTAKVDALVRGWIAKGQKPVRYTFRNYPGDKLCNPKIQKTFFENGCLAARVAGGAAKIGGAEAFWKAHDWLIKNPKGFGPQSVPAVAAAAGVDAAKLQSLLQDADVNAAIGLDVAAGDALGAAQPMFGIPSVYVNGRWVRTWMKDAEGDILERVVDEAAKK